VSRLRRFLPSLAMLAPTILLVFVFVYGLIAWNFQISLTDRDSLSSEYSYVGLANYADLLTDPRFLHSVRNLAIFTVVFIGGTMLMGLAWALLLERGITGEGAFRTIYLFPMAVSFVASGVVWRWLLNSAQGDNAGGLNQLFQMIGLGGLQNPWWSHPTWGMAAMALPAVWQLTGYVMALFLAGFRGISDDQREAARIDGASEFQLYRHVLFPQLSPVALSAIIIVGHMSLKVFDLIMAISGAVYVTEVPATFLWDKLLGNEFAVVATTAALMLVAVAVVIIPYLVITVRQERE
jgi:glucose/mannose transport system permease protein